MDGVRDVDTALLEQVGQLAHRVLGLGDGEAVAGHDDDLLGVGELDRRVVEADLADVAARRPRRRLRHAAPPPPKPPTMMLAIDRFMASAISLVRIAPDAPTSAPAMISTGLPITKPAIAAAVPVNELSSEMTTGMSAPPMGSTMVTPKISAGEDDQRPGVRISTSAVEGDDVRRAQHEDATKPATVTSASRTVSSREPGKKIGWPETMPCSLPDAISEPEKVTEPMTAPRTTKIARR